ncbi:putative syntaxin [Papiliotrema laurentii]|uniref:Syntaxin n=1 Tax=Papiliotrema laurentii TaxID=5418 RepID=A0AAD9FLQ2_PAPLA|nr:putative syntaxin [Papiliotrema laurentii]
MARDRLAANRNNYADQSAVGQTTSYPPPSNAVIGQSRAPNPYAQQQQQQQPGNPYAQAYGQEQGYASGGYGNGEGAAAVNGAGAGAGDFWSELSATNGNLSQLQEEIQAVRSAHQQSLTSTDPGASAHADQLNDQARATREQCKNQIKRLFKLAKGDKAMKNQVEAVKTRFTTLLQEHQVVEKEFRKKVKDRVERQYRIVNPNATEEEVRQVTESDNPQVFSQALLNSNRYGAARGAYREVQERHAEIQKIEKTLTELAQMFQEMSMLVEQQDETIVNVENQAMGVDKDVQDALKQTSRAVESARKARRKKWICFWILVAIVCILALVLGLYFGVGKK